MIISNVSVFYKSISELSISNSGIQQIANGLQQTIDRVKKKLTDGTLRLAIPNSEKPFYILCDTSNYGIGAALHQKNQFGKI